MRTGLLQELRRRNVIRVTLGYIGASWLLIQVADTLFPVFGLADSAMRILLLVLVIGYVPTLVLTWVFEWTPDGIVRDAGGAGQAGVPQHRIFDRIVMVVLAIAVAYFAVDKFVIGAAPGKGDNSIVVLPLVSMGADQDDEYFSDGLTEELLNVLARIPDLDVASRTTSFFYKDRTVTAAEVADTLDVTYVLEGSVRKAGDTVRVTAQLIDGRNDTHVWSETFDREFGLEEILQVQDEIARLVADKLELTIFDRGSDRVDPVAYEANLQARYLINLYDPANVEAIDALIAKGLEADPDYAPLLWVKDRLLAHKRMYGLLPPGEVAQLKRELRARLRVLDPDNARWLFVEMMQQTDLAAGARLMAEAYHKAPGDADIIENVARGARGLGQVDVAIALDEALVQNHPTTGRYYFRLGLSYNAAGRYEDAIETLEQAKRFGTGNLDPSFGLASAHLLRGDPQAALDLFEASGNLGDGGWADMFALLALHDLGDIERYDEIYGTAWEGFGWDLRAMVAAWTGDADLAFEYLDMIYAGDPSPRLRLELVPPGLFYRIVEDPRWDALVERLGVSDEDLAAAAMDIDVTRLRALQQVAE